eukprot:GEMP01035440.1.p1 GENE.GEMP01035440.1~~GEMP01035440.1.p1  ORF type:complete len:455 (+),score=117.00 GEMP01035440.1:122-1486(+)
MEHTLPPESDEKTAHLESRINTPVMDRVTFLFTGEEPINTAVPKMTSLEIGSMNSDGISTWNRAVAPTSLPRRVHAIDRMTQMSHVTSGHSQPRVSYALGHDVDAGTASIGTPNSGRRLPPPDPRLTWPPPIDHSFDGSSMGRSKTSPGTRGDNHSPGDKKKWSNLVHQIVHADEVVGEDDTPSQRGDHDEGGVNAWSADDWCSTPVVNRLLDAGKRYQENAEEKRKQKTAKESSHVKLTFQSPKSLAINRKNKRDFYERRLLYIEKKTDARVQQAQEKQMKELTFVTGRPSINPRSRRLAEKQEHSKMEHSIKKWVMQRRLCRKEESIREERETEEAKQFSFQPTLYEQSTEESFVQLKPFHLRLIDYTEKWLDREKKTKSYIARNMTEETFRPEVGHRTRTMSPRGSAVFDDLYNNTQRPPSLTRPETKQTVRVPNTKFDELADIVKYFGHA